MTELTITGARKLMKHLFGEATFTPGRLVATVTDAAKNSYGGSTPVPTDWSAPVTDGTVVSTGTDDLIVVGDGEANPSYTEYQGAGLKDVNGALLMWEDVTTLGVGRPYDRVNGVDFPAQSLKLSFDYDGGYVTNGGQALTMTEDAVTEIIGHLLSATDTSFSAIPFGTVDWTITLYAGNTAVSSQNWNRPTQAAYTESAGQAAYTNVGDLSFPSVTSAATITSVGVSIGGTEYWRMTLGAATPVTTTSIIKIPTGQLKVGLAYIS